MSSEAIDLLRSIDASLKQLLAQSRARQPKQVASDRDLDGKYGDPIVKVSPRDWTGQSFKGFKMSDCPAPFLEMVAETFDYFAQQAERNSETTDRGKPVAEFKRADAARARGWAKRIREGKHVPSTVGAVSGEWGSEGEGF